MRRNLCCVACHSLDLTKQFSSQQFQRDTNKLELLMIGKVLIPGSVHPPDS